MDIGEYIEKASGWLFDATCVYDLAESTRKAMNHDYELPEKASSWEGAPYLGSWKGQERLQNALPLLLKTSLEAGKAAELSMCDDYNGSDSGKTAIPFANQKSPRVGATIARMGIITQFELWKEFVSEIEYPINKKQAKKFTFNSEIEKDTLIELVELRNELTHEMKLENDPTMRQLVEFAYTCRWLAEKAVQYD